MCCGAAFVELSAASVACGTILPRFNGIFPYFYWTILLLSICIFYCFTLCLFLPSIVRCSLDHELARKSRYSKGLKLTSTDYPAYRLPTNLKPTNYDLLFYPLLSNSTFKGKERITFDVINATNEIVLNVRFDSIVADSLKSFVNQSSPLVEVRNTTHNETYQMVSFRLSDTLKPQKGVVIDIEYDGVLANDMMGFYLSTYNTTDSYGQPTEHLMAITQFESTYARRAFPCFDEPAYRAKFNISIVRTNNQTSMSNMPLKEFIIYNHTVDNYTDELVLDVYETSPEMPTYLVAFGVSDFAWRSDGGNVKVWTRPSVIKDAAYALSVGQPILDSIGNFTNVSYPLEKIDIVAVPDFSAGAMENWGLTTYREKYVLYNPIKNTMRDKFGVLSVIAHEFGHQWFGDLVTPQWWDYIWLNEGFATYFEYITPNQLHPEWNIGSTMFTIALQSALALDIGDPKAMSSPVYTPDQIEGNFDYNVYEKGGSVLRMTENFLTTAVWRDGLNRYLTKNAYKTGTPDELFSALEDAALAANSSASSNVTAMLTTWTTQPGYPVVTLQNIANQVFSLTQSPYEMNTTNLTWLIPLTFTTQEEAQFDATKAARMLLTTRYENVTINTKGWIILNVDQIGYFRVAYDQGNWYKIINQLKSNHSVIGPINRAQLLDDASHLAKTGHLNYSIYMDLTEYLPKETDYAPWNAFFTNMRFLVNQFYNTSTGDGLMKYARDIMAPPYQALTSSLNSSKPFLDSLTLLDAGRFSCDMRLPECEQMASTAFQKWTQDPDSLVPEIKPAVICTQLRMDTSGKSFQQVFDYFLNSENGAEKLALIRAMGCVSNEAAINMYLNVVCDVNANHVRSQDRYIAFNALLSHQSGVAPGLQYLVNSYDKVIQGVGSKNFDSLFSTLGKTISQDAHIDQVMKLANDSQVDQRLREKLNTLVLPPVLKRQAWAASPQAALLKSWIHDHNKSSASSVVAHSTFILLFTSFTICIQLFHKI